MGGGGAIVFTVRFTGNSPAVFLAQPVPDSAGWQLATGGLLLLARLICRRRSSE